MFCVTYVFPYSFSQSKKTIKISSNILFFENKTTALFYCNSLFLIKKITFTSCVKVCKILNFQLMMNFPDFRLYWLDEFLYRKTFSYSHSNYKKQAEISL